IGRPTVGRPWCGGGPTMGWVALVADRGRAGRGGVGRGGSSPWRLAVVAGVVHGGGSGRSGRGGRPRVAVMVGWRWGGRSVIVDNFVQDGVIWHGSVLVRFGIIQNKDFGSVGYGGVAVGVAIRGGSGRVVRVMVADREAHRGLSVVWWRPGGGGGWPCWPTVEGRPWWRWSCLGWSSVGVGVSRPWRWRGGGGR
nr:hypothetical protein [Tanacetum cinerariifolium]